MNRNNIINRFLTAFDSHNEQEINELLDNHLEVLFPYIALSNHNNPIDWTSLVEHPLFAAANNGYLETVQSIIRAVLFHHEPSLYKENYDLQLQQLKSKIVLPDADITSLKNILYLLFPYNDKKELLPIQVNCIDYLFNISSVLEEVEITKYRMFSHACQNNSLFLMNHFLEKLVEEVNSSDIDYHDLRDEQLLDIVNMTPKNPLYQNRALSTILQGIYLGVRRQNVPIIKSIINSTELVYLPEIFNSNEDQFFIKDVEDVLKRKQLFFELQRKAELSDASNNCKMKHKL